MSDVGAAIVERLEREGSYTAAIGARTDWGVSPTGTAYPRVVLNFVTALRDDHFGGSDMRFTRLQLDVYSDRSSGEAAEISEYAIAALQPDDVAGGVRFERALEVEGPTDSGEQTDTLYAYRARTVFALLHADEA